MTVCSNNNPCVAGAMPYMIRKGDTLYALAQIYDSSVERIMELNSSIDPMNLQIGQIICIPLPPETYPNCRTTNYYVARDGDTLVSIASYFGVDVRQLLYSNMGIDPQNIYRGMVLCIPVAPSPVCLEATEDYIAVLDNDGNSDTFKARLVGELPSEGEYRVLQKRLDSGEEYGAKELSLSAPSFTLCSESSKIPGSALVIGNEDMLKLFNMVPVGTNVAVMHS
ncbi:MAG: LysM domain-containing protein [Clostridia bacterium]|nr:LysM domain-containing protein [Clostridia bacterium]